MKNLGFGFMRLPLLDKNDVTSIDEEQLCKMVDCFLEQGFTYFDTAWGIRYAASLDGVMMVLSGMNSIEQVKDNTGYMKEFVPLNKEEKEIINKVTEIIQNIIAIPCTSCRYCVDDCPKKIPIPDIFTIYNGKERSRDVYFPKVHYEKLVAEENHGKASECIKCRQCEQHCPQHIEVTKWLEQIAGEFE